MQPLVPVLNPDQRRTIGYTNPAAAKAFYQPLYHYQAYPALGAQVLSFFGTPFQQAPGGYDDTNMVAAGQLTQRALQVSAIEVMYFPGVELAADSVDYAEDARKLFQSGRLEFTVNGELVSRDAPIGLFAGASRLHTDGVGYGVAVGPRYGITLGEIPPNTQFGVDLKWSAPVPVSVAGRIGVRLLGVELRTA